MISVTINGERREIPEGLTVVQLVSHLGLAADRIAMECNLDVLPRSQWQATRVEPGDAFEIVHFVGGGAVAGQFESS
ncbi:MAG TPA: sulfur carrier protein ThiS [Candidatus Acidoferrales bacterium]|nr:sulfur carrier protein ThiS [Candidatus Acidoferrales bacterium]